MDWFTPEEDLVRQILDTKLAYCTGGGRKTKLKLRELLDQRQEDSLQGPGKSQPQVNPRSWSLNPGSVLLLGGNSARKVLGGRSPSGVSCSLGLSGLSPRSSHYKHRLIEGLERPWGGADLPEWFSPVFRGRGLLVRWFYGLVGSSFWELE